MNWSRILRVGGWAVKSKNTATAQPSTTNTHSTAEHSHLHFHSTMPQPPPYKTVGASSLNMGRALGVGGKDLKGWSKRAENQPVEVSWCWWYWIRPDTASWLGGNIKPIPHFRGLPSLPTIDNIFHQTLPSFSTFSQEYALQSSLQQRQNQGKVWCSILIDGHNALYVCFLQSI